MITQKELKKFVRYDHKIGIFIRVKKTNNRHSVGDIAGSKFKNGYIYIWINKKRYTAHRLAFLYMEGYFPENDIDHIDRNRSNNKWDNLREVSRSCNVKNSKLNSRNNSGIKGVSWHKQAQKWVTDIYTNKKSKYLGVFKDFDEAVCHRLAAEQCLNWSGCDSNSSAYKYVKENAQC